MFLLGVQSGGSKRGAPPTVQNFLNFMQFFGKFAKIIGLRPLPGGSASPPTENPGSAPGLFAGASLSRRGLYLGDLCQGNERAVHILLECFLVFDNILSGGGVRPM